MHFICIYPFQRSITARVYYVQPLKVDSLSYIPDTDAQTRTINSSRFALSTRQQQKTPTPDRRVAQLRFDFTRLWNCKRCSTIYEAVELFLVGWHYGCGGRGTDQTPEYYYATSSGWLANRRMWRISQKRPLHKTIYHNVQLLPSRTDVSHSNWTSSACVYRQKYIQTSKQHRQLLSVHTPVK